MPPPLLPSERLRRVLRVARIDGLSVLVVAGGFGVLSAAFGDFSGAAVGFVIAAAGAVELRGVSLLKAARIEGMNWLIASQAYLLLLILGYAAYRLANLAHDPLIRVIVQGLREAGADPEMLPIDLHQMMKATYCALALITVLYQGGMIVYYRHRRAAAAAALQPPS
jgi:hypothetical protein